MLQLDLPLTSKSPIAWTARTLLDNDRAIFGEFDRDRFCTPALSKHVIFVPGEILWIGHIWRYDRALPWEIHRRGEDDPKVVGMDFDMAVDRLIAWHHECRLRDQDWLKQFSKAVDKQSTDGYNDSMNFTTKRQ